MLKCWNGMTQTGMLFTGYVGGSQLAEVSNSWLHMRKWAWVGSSWRDAQQHLSVRVKKQGEVNSLQRWRWNLATHNASACWHLGQCLRVVAGTNLITRLHVHSVLAKHVAGHHLKRYESVSWLTSILFSGIHWGNVASRSTNSMLPFLWGLFWNCLYFTFILIQAIENRPVNGALTMLSPAWAPSFLCMFVSNYFLSSPTFLYNPYSLT